MSPESSRNLPRAASGRIVGGDGQRRGQMFFRSIFVAELFEHSGQFHLGRRERRILSVPIFHHLEGFFATAFFHQQDGETSAAVDMVGLRSRHWR